MNRARRRAPLHLRMWFDSQVDRRGPDECWPWTGKRFPAGYGRFVVGAPTEQMGAHRAAYEYAHGPIPDGLLILHSCDNPPCCNDTHLRPGDHTENVADMDAKSRAARPVFHGEDHGMAKLTIGQVREIRRRADAGEAVAVIARDFPVGETQTRRIVRREAWP